MADTLPNNPTTDPAAIAALIRATQGGGLGLPSPSPDTTAPGANPALLSQAIQGGGMPSAVPAPSAPTGSDDALRQMILGGSEFAKNLATEQTGRMRTAEDARTQALAQQQTLMANPPQIAPKNAILRVLLGLTAPGRMAESAYYQPGVERFEAQRKALADKIATLGTQAEEEGKVIPSALSAVGRGYQAYGSAERGQAAMLTAQTRALTEQHQNTNRQTALALQRDLGTGKLTQEAARTKMMGQIAEQRNETLQAIARQATAEHWSATQLTAATQQADDIYNTESTHWLQNIIGTSPAVPQTTPATPAATPDQKNRANKVKSSKGNAAKPVGNTVNF